MSRGQTSNLVAVFAMPGLEEIAAPLYPYIASRADAVALVGYLAARPAARSANALDAELATPWVWDQIRDAARAQRRVLPDRPPSFNKLHHLRSRIGDDIDAVLFDMQVAFTGEAFKIARLAGLADPATIVDNLTPTRSNTLYADGTWLDALSKVTVDPDTGMVSGSRTTGTQRSDGSWWREARDEFDPVTGEIVHHPAKKVQGPRVAEVRTTTKNGVPLTGIPFVFAGIRGDDAHRRVVLGVRRFVSPGLVGNGGETTAADELLARVISHSDGGLRWCVYDMAFRGANLHALAKLGVIGVAAMPAAEDGAGLVDDAGEAQPRFNNDGRKVRFSSGSVRNVQHRVRDRWCMHSLSAVDGSLRVHDPARGVQLSDPLCPVEELWFEPADRGDEQRLMARFQVPCPDGALHPVLELTGKLDGAGPLVLNRIRPIHEYDRAFEAFKAWRQDAESLNATIKQALPRYGEASSLRPAHIELDLLGCALWINAQCWDVHVARVCHAAKNTQRLARNRQMKAPTAI